ncbi:MAG: CRISPR-associated endoribonuclease Cas6 [Ruminococcus flavefaciens]|nr:CRISPR-associated endoribonuclease Cas6 [Ruminococcus flavefaciens]MCM1361304.1 CRISPR-associated endoribonuclease Cas6 [Clostridiales bacterium]
MKTISITFQSSGIPIPISYQYGVQSLLYSILRQADSTSTWHDNGYEYNKRTYKLFTFSSLRGKKTIADKRITFHDLMYLDVRSASDAFCNALIVGLKSDEKFELYGNQLSVQSVTWESPEITESSLKIKMLSPLTVYRTENGKSKFYTPLDKEFSEQINQNFQRKYAAFTGNMSKSDIRILPLHVSGSDKYVTTFKDIHITAWRGEYQLFGNPEYLQFLYYCGLGAKNSNGFGMFEVL